MLDTDGSAWCWDGTAEVAPVRVTGNLTFRMLVAGYDHTCGLATTDEVYCWGANASGQLGNGSRTDASAPVPVRF